MKPIDLIPKSACGEARKWAEAQTGTHEEAWNACPRGDWLLWFAAHVGVRRELLVLAACDCAESVIGLVESDSLLACVWAIDSARRLTARETDDEEVRAAAYAADAAAYAAADAAASHAAAAACVSYAAASHAAAYASYAARTEKHAECAGFVRAHIPWAVIEKALDVRRGEGT